MFQSSYKAGKSGILIKYWRGEGSALERDVAKTRACWYFTSCLCALWDCQEKKPLLISVLIRNARRKHNLLQKSSTVSSRIQTYRLESQTHDTPLLPLERCLICTLILSAEKWGKNMLFPSIYVHMVLSLFSSLVLPYFLQGTHI